MVLVKKRILGIGLMLLVAALAGCTASENPVSLEEDEEQRDRGNDGEGPGGQSVDLSELNETMLAEGYTGHGAGAFAFNTGCEWGPFEPGGPENLGGACFELEKNAKRGEFEVKDDLTPDVGVYIRYDITGETAGFFCNDGRFDPPEAASSVMVILGDTGTCVLQGLVTAPTTGEISVTLYHE